jgi:RHS repeat-associated protein
VNAALAAPGLTDLEISRGAVPSSGNADFQVPLSPKSNMLATTLAQPQAGTYYILLQGRSAAGSGQTFTLSATPVMFGAFGVSPSTVGTGRVSLLIDGAGFAAGSSVAQVGSSGQVIANASDVTASNPNTLLADFDLTSAPVGTYSLKIVSGGQTASLADSISVQAAAGPGSGGGTVGTGTGDITPVQFSLGAPSVARFGHVYDVLVKYTNPNNVDVPAPVFQLSQPNAEFELVSGNGDAKIVPDTTFSPGSIELMAMNQEGNAGVLPPNYTGVYDVRFTAINNIAHSPLDITLNVTDPSAPFNLFSCVDPIPGGVSELTAEVLKAQIDGLSSLPSAAVSVQSLYPISADLTVTTDALDAYLDSVATRLSTGGLYIPDAASLIGAAADAADGFGAVTQRETAGPFGRGIPDPLRGEIISAFKGIVDVVLPGGNLQYLESGPSFIATDPLNTDILANQPDGTQRLTQLDGSFYQFDANDDLSYYETAGGLQTTFHYDANHDVTSVVAPGNQVTTYTYNGSGLVTSSTDTLGNVTGYGYAISNSVPLLSSVTTPAGTTTITYTPTPASESLDGTSYYTSSPALAYLPTSITFPDGSGAEFTYDGLGRMTRASLQDGSDPVTETYDATGLGVTTTYADGSTETGLFGPGGIPLESTDATGHPISFTHGPNLLLSSILEPGGARYSLAYDGQGRSSGGVGPTGSTLSLTYDAEGRAIGLTNGDGKTVNVAYDSNSNPTSLTFPDATQEQFAYNAAGQLDRVTGRDGAVTDFTLNGNGFPTEVSYADGTSVSYTYDTHGNMLTSTDSSGTTSYTYNSAQEVTEISYPNGQSVSYRYDALGRVVQESDQSGVLESYTYDADARLSEVLDGSGHLLVAYTYDDLDRVSTETFGNGTRTVYSYDARGDVASIINLAVDGTVSSSLTYTYDARGNPISATDQSGAVTSYAYDPSGQLTKVSLPGGRTITYSYDAAGNRTGVADSGGTETATYAVNDLDQYTSVGSTTYSYDKDDRLLTMTDGAGTTTYTYDAVGRFAGSTGPAGTFTYSYSSLGLLDGYTANGVRTNLLIDAGGDVLAAYDAGGNLIGSYQYGLQLIARQSAGGAESFYDFDLTGNTTSITNASGAVTATYSYLPFGEKLSSAGGQGNLFSYAGSFGSLDLGDGFYHDTYRTYSPSLGRFIQPDPAGFDGGDSNLYRYVGNSPTTAADPSGLSPEEGKVSPISASNPSNTGYGGYRPPNQQPGGGSGGTPGGGDPGGGGDIVKPGSQGEQTTYGSEVQSEGASDDAGGEANILLTAIKVAAVAAYVLGGKGEVETSNELLATLHQNDPVNFPFTYQIPLPKGYIPARDRGPVAWLRQLKRAEQEDGENPLRDDYLDSVLVLHAHIRLVNGLDPNEIDGPAGGGANQEYITATQPLSYTVFFENQPTATGPAQDVTVTTTLDPSVDLSTFQLQSIGWGNEVLSVPPGLTSYSTRVSYVQPNTGKTILVDASAVLDLRTRTLTWTFATLDPTTLDSPADALGGFLPPDNATGQGTGFVSYAVDPVSGLASGTAIDATASVVFDFNVPISTKTWTNIIDAIPPTSSVAPLAATQPAPNFPVSWSGQDDPEGSGIASYSIYVSIDGGAFALWTTTGATSAEYGGSPGHAYAFYSIATDNVGNVQRSPTSIATTTVITPTVTPSPTPTTPMSTPPVTVTSLQVETIKVRKGKKAMNEAVLVLDFSGALNGDAAGNPGAYQIAPIIKAKARGKGKHRQAPGIKLGTPVPAALAVYNASNHSVTLTPRGKFNLAKPEELTVNAALVTDALDRPIDGNANGQPGSNYVATFGRGGVTVGGVAAVRTRERADAVPDAIDFLLGRGELSELRRSFHIYQERFDEPTRIHSWRHEFAWTGNSWESFLPMTDDITSRNRPSPS